MRIQRHCVTHEIFCLFAYFNFSKKNGLFKAKLITIYCWGLKIYKNKLNIDNIKDGNIKLCWSDTEVVQYFWGLYCDKLKMCLINLWGTTYTHKVKREVKWNEKLLK